MYHIICDRFNVVVLLSCCYTQADQVFHRGRTGERTCNINLIIHKKKKNVINCTEMLERFILLLLEYRFI